jgi:uncharacterized integral membrane protein
MRLSNVNRNRKARAWVVLIALAIMLTLIVAVFLLSGRSPKPFEMDDLYGLLD